MRVIIVDLREGGKVQRRVILGAPYMIIFYLPEGRGEYTVMADVMSENLFILGKIEGVKTPGDKGLSDVNLSEICTLGNGGDAYVDATLDVTFSAEALIK